MPPKPISSRKTFGAAPYLTVGGLSAVILSLPTWFVAPSFARVLQTGGAAAVLIGAIWLAIGGARYYSRLAPIEKRRKEKPPTAAPTEAETPSPNAREPQPAQ